MPNPAQALSLVRASKRPGWVESAATDGAKKVKGFKRHVLVDTHGLVLKAKVHPADVMDRAGVTLLLPPAEITEEFPRLSPMSAGCRL